MLFLGKTGATITGRVTGPRHYSHDLPQGGMEIPWVMKLAGDKIMVNKMKSLLVDTRRPIPSSAHVPVRVCSGTTPSSMSCGNSSNVEPEQPKKANVTVETDNALPNASVETMALAFVKIDDERITDSIDSEEVLKRVRNVTMNLKMQLNQMGKVLPQNSNKAVNMMLRPVSS